jgi:hypothetical protein
MLVLLTTESINMSFIQKYVLFIDFQENIYRIEHYCLNLKQATIRQTQVAR